MYDKILVPLDGSKLAEAVIPYVEALAQGCQVREIILLRVCEPFSVLADYPATLPVSFEENVKQINQYGQNQCRIYLDNVEEQLKEKGLSVRTESRLGSPAEQIVNFAKENNIDLIVMASHGRSGPGRWAYGSVADKVFRTTCVPLMIIRGPGCVIGV